MYLQVWFVIIWSTGVVIEEGRINAMQRPAKAPKAWPRLKMTAQDETYL